MKYIVKGYTNQTRSCFCILWDIQKWCAYKCEHNCNGDKSTT
nr:hypothetical protein [Clostridium botulinum]